MPAGSREPTTGNAFMLASQMDWRMPMAHADLTWGDDVLPE